MSLFPIFHGGGKAEIALTDSPVSTATATVYTFSAASLGVAAGSRKIIVAVAGADDTRTISTLTVGGVSASFVVRQQHVSKTVEIWQADVPTGTTGDVVVTWSGGQVSCGIGVFRAVGAASAAHDTGGGTGDGGSGAASDTLNIPANGIAIAVSENPDSRTITWAGVTEDYDEVMDGVQFHSGGSAEFATLQTGLTISATPSGTATHLPMACASWGPA